ncbi:MAG: DUF615 domain-containing protein [Gammaproteobacteria bacterium HGW-Gammaproteobacteria-8]|nr:MAG: DUF615 domain-containing protein [Gammaproteobacteria bacterium HGW-Gammaproteobacteria-8]
MSPRPRSFETRSDPEDDAVDDGSPSKTALKAEDRALQDLGVALAELPAGPRKRLPIDEDLRRALEEYNAIRAHGARKRQRKFLGRLLRQLDTEPLQRAVDAFREGRQADAAALHSVERWREELVADDAALTRWMIEHPETDVQHLRGLIRNARKAGDIANPSERHSRAWRELFKEIRDRMNAAVRASSEAQDEAR